MNKLVRILFAVVSISLTTLMTTQVVLAQDNFPSRPIRIIVP
jgi:hypothetical protein